MNYQEIFSKNIDNIKKQDRYRVFRSVEKDIQKYPDALVDKEKKTIWCSNDYLGMSKNQSVIDAFVDCAKISGVGSGGTRNISGNTEKIEQLESDIAKFHNKQSGLVFTSGYVSNLATISAIVSIIPDIVIFSDEKNHASIISGIRHNNANREIFLHNDMKDLEEKLKKYSKDSPKMIVFEGIYSMDASHGEVCDIVDLAKKYNAMTYIDEVHAVGLYGKCGRGIANHFELDNEIDFIEATFAKSFGVIGGYITCNNVFKDAIRLNASGFIFTSSLPPSICSAISKSIEIIGSKEGDLLREKHFEIVDCIKNELTSKKIPFLNNEKINSHIIPIMINDAKRAQKISDKLMSDFGIYAQNINYPTVPFGSERIRITASPYHNTKEAIDLCNALKKCIDFC